MPRRIYVHISIYAAIESRPRSTERLTLLRWKEDFAERLGVVCRIITELLLDRLVPTPPPPPPWPKSKWCRRLSLPPMVLGPC